MGTSTVTLNESLGRSSAALTTRTPRRRNLFSMSGSSTTFPATAVVVDSSHPVPLTDPAIGNPHKLTLACRSRKSSEAEADTPKSEPAYSRSKSEPKPTSEPPPLSMRRAAEPRTSSHIRASAERDGRDERCGDDEREGAVVVCISGRANDAVRIIRTVVHAPGTWNAAMRPLTVRRV